jgi:hypothetical protein
MRREGLDVDQRLMNVGGRSSVERSIGHGCRQRDLVKVHAGSAIGVGVVVVRGGAEWPRLRGGGGGRVVLTGDTAHSPVPSASLNVLQVRLYLADEVGLQVGNVGLEPLALVTPAEVHDGQLPGLSSGARPQAQAHRSITYFRFLSKDFLEGYRLWIAGQQGEVEQYRLDLRAREHAREDLGGQRVESDECDTATPTTGG